MSMIRKISILFAGLAMAASLGVAHAQDAVIDQAKAQGIVGEMYTGYLGIADASKATPDIKRHVDEINAKRLAIYNDTAAKTNQPMQTIAALTAEKQIARAGSGEAVKPGADQPWTKKP
ncbi:MAG: DUF1318 domain-containing protein [Alphaproteobacteria bacterium]|nr:DUF1318 domain-containing protein [Alphaproteobacteria bacterium]